MILLTFRKAVLPIEVESNDDSADYTDSHQYEGGDGEEAEQICAKMKKIREAIDGKASACNLQPSKVCLQPAKLQKCSKKSKNQAKNHQYITNNNNTKPEAYLLPCYRYTMCTLVTLLLLNCNNQHSNACF